MISTRTSQLIVTSAHYTVIAKALDCEEYLVTNLLKIPWPLSLYEGVLFEKSQLRKVSWRRIFCTHMSGWDQGRNQLFISGGQFSWTFIRWRHRAYSTVIQLFRKWSQICSFRNISENDNLLVFIRPVTRGPKPTLKIVSPRWKNVLDIV